MMRYAAAAVAAFLVFSGAKPSQAADTRDLAFQPAKADGWIVTVKAHVVTTPKWTGSDLMSVAAYPSLSFRRPNEKPKFSSPDDGISVDVFESGAFSVGPVAKYRAGRYNGSNRELAGIHDTKWTLEGGVAANYWITPALRARGEIRRGFREKDGFEAKFGVDLVQSFRSWTVAVGPRLAIADGSFMRNHFGVTTRDALLNPRVAAYKPEAGIKSVGAYASATYQFNDAWAATLHGGYERLVGDAAKSPIIKTIGSPNQYMIGLSLAYSFPVKGW